MQEVEHRVWVIVGLRRRLALRLRFLPLRKSLPPRASFFARRDTRSSRSSPKKLEATPRLFFLS